MPRPPHITARQHTELFGFNTSKPWVPNVARLLFKTPRAFEPLVAAWEIRHPGTYTKLHRLTKAGFVVYQPAIYADIITGKLVDKPSPTLKRYFVTKKGKKLTTALAADARSLAIVFPKADEKNLKAAATIILACSSSEFLDHGLSGQHLASLTKLSPAFCRIWLNRLVDKGFLSSKENCVGDKVELVPAHWRPTNAFAYQLRKVLTAYPKKAMALAAELDLVGFRALKDIAPPRFGPDGASDWDHDVQVQVVLAAFMRSAALMTTSVFEIEPRRDIAIEPGVSPWSVNRTGTAASFYYPDAELREHGDVALTRSVLEFERFQARKDAWTHIERFLGWMHLRARPGDAGVLRFVLDSASRTAAYVELIEAFADYSIEHPERVPNNIITLAVASKDDVLQAPDPLRPEVWARLTLTPSAAPRLLIHDPRDPKTPYSTYFSQDH